MYCVIKFNNLILVIANYFILVINKILDFYYFYIKLVLDNSRLFYA